MTRQITAISILKPIMLLAAYLWVVLINPYWISVVLMAAIADRLMLAIRDKRTSPMELFSTATKTSIVTTMMFGIPTLLFLLVNSDQGSAGMIFGGAVGFVLLGTINAAIVGCAMTVLAIIYLWSVGDTFSDDSE